MTTFRKKLTNLDDLDFANSQSLALNLIKIGKSQIEEMLRLMLKPDFELSSLNRLHKKTTSELTHMAGLYLIVNKRTKKIYLGGTGDLAQRKGEHHYNLTKPKRRKKLSKSMLTDLIEGTIDDFYYVPIVTFDQNLIKNLKITQGNSLKKELSIFLDQKVEKVILEEFFNANSEFCSYFYNEKTVGAFQINNTYGGSPKSGTKNRPVSFQNKYAWESISAAAKSLNKDRKTIRNKRDSNILQEINSEEFLNFSGLKITNETAVDFFKDRQDELQSLTSNMQLR